MPASASSSADRRWAAVLARDSREDGRFVFAVRSTGVYCRPSCPSRRPRPERVAFFDTCDDAERAGFRACLRCRPRERATDPLVARVRAAAAWIARHVDEPFTLASLATRAGCSPAHLQRTFTRVMGASPREYQARLRVKALKGALRAGAGVLDAAFAAGFGSSSRVYERAGPTLGMTPAAYRRGGAGEDVRYATSRCALGVLLVAATTRGICAVRLGSSVHDLVTRLRQELPAAAIAPGDGLLEDAVRTIVAHIEGQDADFARLPLDLRGTAFQQRVWDALTRIPRGVTRSYAEIATAIGAPAATRAVAAACAANPVAILVPCHRVVPKTGGTGGYRWGRERKRRLVQLERQRS